MKCGSEPEISLITCSLEKSCTHSGLRELLENRIQQPVLCVHIITSGFDEFNQFFIIIMSVSQKLLRDAHHYNVV